MTAIHSIKLAILVRAASFGLRLLFSLQYKYKTDPYKIYIDTIPGHFRGESDPVVLW